MATEETQTPDTPTSEWIPLPTHNRRDVITSKVIIGIIIGCMVGALFTVITVGVNAEQFVPTTKSNSKINSPAFEMAIKSLLISIPWGSIIGGIIGLATGLLINQNEKQLNVTISKKNAEKEKAATELSKNEIESYENYGNE